MARLSAHNLGNPDNGPYLEHTVAPKDKSGMNTKLKDVLLVFLGGAFGTAAREGLNLLIPPVQGIPYTVFGINILGAFALGAFITRLVSVQTAKRRALRLLMATGFLGGFTTYSALAGNTAQLLSAENPLFGLGYGLLTLFVGGLASWLGILVAKPRQHPDIQKVPK